VIPNKRQDLVLPGFQDPTQKKLSPRLSCTKFGIASDWAQLLALVPQSAHVRTKLNSNIFSFTSRIHFAINHLLRFEAKRAFLAAKRHIEEQAGLIRGAGMRISSPAAQHGVGKMLASFSEVAFFKVNHFVII